MTDKPFMPKATAVWLVENTKISFKQIADFCDLHEHEIKGIADGDVAKGIKAYNPILAGQLTREEIEECSKNINKPLILNKKILEEIEKLNKNLSKIEKIKKFIVIKNQFSIENGMLTPTLKLKRYKIIQKYKKELEKLY